MIRRIIKYLLVFNIAFMSYINAADYELCDSKLLELEIAHEGITRIVFADEKINDIVIYPQDTAIAELHSSGCVFILPQLNAINNRIYLTLIGENNTFQDLLLVFKAKMPEPVRLIAHRNSISAELLPLINDSNKIGYSDTKNIAQRTKRKIIKRNNKK